MAIIFGAWWDVASGTYAIVHTTYIQISYSSVKVGMLTVGIKIGINTLHIAHRIYIELMRAILSKVTTLFCEYRITIQSPNTELQYRKHIYPTLAKISFFKNWFFPKKKMSLSRLLNVNSIVSIHAH